MIQGTYCNYFFHGYHLSLSSIISERTIGDSLSWDYETSWKKGRKRVAHGPVKLTSAITLLIRNRSTVAEDVYVRQANQ